MNEPLLFEDLPIIEQARYLRRHEPDKAVAYDLKRHDATHCARMFHAADLAGGMDALDVETRAALLQWAAMIDQDRAVIRGGAR